MRDGARSSAPATTPRQAESASFEVESADVERQLEGGRPVDYYRWIVVRARACP